MKIKTESKRARLSDRAATAIARQISRGELKTIRQVTAAIRGARR